MEIQAAGCGPVRFDRPIRTTHHTLTLFPDMRSLLASMRGQVAQARERVWIETYIYRADRLGRSFAAELACAVRRGADVRLLYDPLGCEETDPAFFEAMRAMGIHVRPYRPAEVVVRSGAWWPRDHSRIVVIDGNAYTGGVAWGDEWLPMEEGGKDWHEVSCQIVGPCVEDFELIFKRRWAEAAGVIEVPQDYETSGKYPDLELVADSPSAENAVFWRHIDRIRQARRRILIENSYFLPPRGFEEALYDAAARGVDVRLILSGPTDLPVIKRAARAQYAEWLAHGLSLFEYQPTILHAKFAVIDDDWATVGTFNINAASLRWANEVNLFVHNPAFVALTAGLFEQDLLCCAPVTVETLERQPLLEQLGDVLAQKALRLLEFGRGAPAEP